MSRCIVHYGMPKTGSSAIQTWMLRKLADPRFLYLNLGALGSGNRMVEAFVADTREQQRPRNRGLDHEQLQAGNATVRASIAAQLERLGERTALFSAELLANTRPETVRAVHGFLRERCDRIEAVGYVRAPVAFMESVFQQRLRAGNPGLRFELLYPDYRRRFEIFEQLLDRAAVSYWSFAPQSFPRGCVVRDFCARVGIDPGTRAIRRANDSLSLDAIRLLYAYRRFGPGYGTGAPALRENRNLIRVLGELAGPRLRFDHEAVAPVLAARREDRDWIEERLGSRLDEQDTAGQDAVREEADLLRFSRASIDWLATQRGVRRLPADPTPQQVAEALHAVRLRAESSPRRWWQRLRSSPGAR